MFWFALAAIASTAASAGKAASAAQQQQSEATTAQLNAYTDSLKQVDTQNEAIDTANTANLVRTGYKIGIQNLQLARLKKQAAEGGYDLSVQGLQAMSANVANAAASGTVGSSVDATVQDIQKKQDEAQIGQDQSFSDMLENAHLALEQTVMQGQDAMISTINPNLTVPTVQNNPNNTWNAALTAGVGEAFSLYTQNTISLGKGNTTSKTSAASAGAYSSALGGVGPVAPAATTYPLNFGNTSQSLLK